MGHWREGRERVPGGALLTADETRAAIVSALATAPDEHLARVLRLLSLGTPEELQAELSARRDIEAFGKRHPLTPTTSDAWALGLVLAMWRALGACPWRRR